MDEIGRLASRYKELRGRHVHKTPQSVLDMESAYKELISDYKEMCKGNENKNHCERVYRAGRRLRKNLLEYYELNGLKLPEYLAGGAQPEKAGAPRYYVAGLPPASSVESLSADSNRG